MTWEGPGAGATRRGNIHRWPFLRSFCPNLSAISTTLKLSHNVAVSFWSSSGTLEGGPEGVGAGRWAWASRSACPEPLDMSPHGVTFLAFGNGAPDIFSALVAFSDPRTAGLAFGALFGTSEGPLLRVRGWEGSRKWARGAPNLASSPAGAGVLVTTVVAGGIAILRPFTAASRPFLRDIVFYMAAVLLIFTALYCGRVTLAWALGERLRDWGGVIARADGWEARGGGDGSGWSAGHRVTFGSE